MSYMLQSPKPDMLMLAVWPEPVSLAAWVLVLGVVGGALQGSCLLVSADRLFLS